MPRMQPVTVDAVTYPSKTHAAIALHRLGGRTAQQIAELIGSTRMAVEQAIKKGRREPGYSPDATPGLWTPEKRDKVRRLFGTTMVYIAEAVQVPPAELLTYVLHGVIPPSQAIKDPDDIRWRGAAPAQAQLPAPPAGEPEAQILPRQAFEQPDVDPPAPDHVEADHLVVEPGRDDDEAELARLAALEEERSQSAHEATRPTEVAPPAPARFHQQRADIATHQPATARPVAPAARLIPVAGGLFPTGRMVRLVNDGGKWLHESLQGFTDKKEHAWEGTRTQFDVVKAQMPRIVAKLQFEVVP